MELNATGGTDRDGGLERNRLDNSPGTLQGWRQVRGDVLRPEHIDAGPKPGQRDDPNLLSAAPIGLLILYANGEVTFSFSRATIAFFAASIYRSWLLSGTNVECLLGL
jgi:hypothetical protein